MKKTVFITGAVRSGKSSLALKLAKASCKQVVFLATCKPQDAEMKKRVHKHKQSRPKTWKTIEEDINVPALIRKFKTEKELIILDCLTLWVSNLLCSGCKEKEILKKIDDLLSALKKTKATVIIVSNEVGWGIVPDNEMARIFRDIMGIAHQKVAKISDEVYLVVSGMMLKMKG